MQNDPVIVCRLSATSAADLAAIDATAQQLPWSESLFKSEFAQPHSLTFGARQAGRLVGFLTVHVLGEEAHILSFSVHSDFQHQGIGTVLLEAALEELYQLAVRSVYLEVRAGNKVAQMMYMSHGFYECGVRERYYSDNDEDALNLRLDLGHYHAQLESRNSCTSVS